MITKEDIKNLATLSRIEMTDEEAESMTSEIDSILGYVGQIQNASVSVDPVVPKHRNIMREDAVTHEDREYTEKILKNVPSREKDYLQVKNIL